MNELAILDLDRKAFNETGIMPQVAHRNTSSAREFWKKTLNISFLVLEVSAVLASFILLYFYRLSQEFHVSIYQKHGISTSLPRFDEYSIFFFVVMVLWLGWLYHFRMFSLKSDISFGLFEETVRSTKAISYSVLITIGIAFVFKLTDYSRFVILSFWFISLVCSVGLRTFKRVLVKALAQKGIFTKNVLIVGAGQVGTQLSNVFSKKPGMGYNVVGFVDNVKRGSVNTYEILGQISQMESIIRRHPIDEIIVTIPTEKQLVNELLNKFRKYDITIRIVPEMFNLVSKTIEVDQSNTIPFITLIKTPMRGLSFLFKRTFDYVFSLIGLLILSPLFLVLAVLIKNDSTGPVFYKQRRVGKNGEFFYMYKFRSMIVNADEMREKLKQLNEVEGPAFKIKEDPRITRIGKFIRKYSLDEIPQLFNVLKGEMSLIGPRPPLPNEVEQYSDWDWRRLEVVPGITGLWQVSGRSELTFEQWVNLDIYYIENWSLWMDWKILLKTIPVVIKGEGAY